MKVVAGLVGSILGGIVLDAFKRFKLTTVWCYMFTLVFMVAFTWMVNKEVLWVDYVFIAALGFFMTGYLPIGFEFGAELTYPESEGITRVKPQRPPRLGKLYFSDEFWPP